MDQLKLDAESITEMKSFYQEELAKTLRRLEHINGVLSQLGEKGAQVQLSFSNTYAKRSKTSTPKRKYKKKRGPKSKWDKAIIKTITSAGRPLSYDEITNYLMISEGRDASKRKNTKATVQNTVFRLRHDRKLSTFSMGSRTKYIAPKTWFNSNGEIKEEFKSKITLPKKAKKPGPKVAKRGPGRPRKNSAQTKAKTGEKAAPKAKVNRKKPTTKKTVQSKVRTASKVKPNTPTKASKTKATKASVPTRAKAKSPSSAKSTAATKKKSTAMKAPAAKRSTPRKSAPQKKADPKTPRKIAMTKTVRTRRKKK